MDYAYEREITAHPEAAMILSQLPSKKNAKMMYGEPSAFYKNLKRCGKCQKALADLFPRMDDFQGLFPTAYVHKRGR